MTAKIRLNATQSEIDNWVTLFKLLADCNVIRLLEVSDKHQNRGESKYQRTYLEADLLVDVDAVKHRFEARLVSNQPDDTHNP